MNYGGQYIGLLRTCEEAADCCKGSCVLGALLLPKKNLWPGALGGGHPEPLLPFV